MVCSSRNCTSFSTSPPKFCGLGIIPPMLFEPPNNSSWSMAEGVMPRVPMRLAVRLMRLPPCPAWSFASYIAGAAIPSSLSNGAKIVNNCSNSVTSFTFFASPPPIIDLTMETATFLRFSHGKNANNAPKSGMSNTCNPILSNGTLSISSNAVVAMVSISNSMLFFVPPPNTIPWPIMEAFFCSCSVPNARAQTEMHRLIRSELCGAIFNAYFSKHPCRRMTSFGGIFSPRASYTRCTHSSNMSNECNAIMNLTSFVSSSSFTSFSS
mmetsp:Transcript_26600/g.45408  ORF Transcript_26600/g.45408 Transcript_26600/m.45408 type:complete len:267 (-) Transcript_26600:645-1445(-)